MFSAMDCAFQPRARQRRWPVATGAGARSAAQAGIGDTGVDHCTAAVLRFENDVVAQISTAVACNIPGEITVFGTDGILRVPQPWLPSSPCRTAPDALPPDTTFPARQAPAMSWADSEGNIRLLDEWRAQIGLSYPQDS